MATPPQSTLRRSTAVLRPSAPASSAWRADNPCQACPLLREALLLDRLDCGLGPTDRLVSVLLPAGARLCDADTEVEHLHLIRSGLVSLVSDVPDGSRRTVRLLKAGDLIGLEGLVDARYRHTALALRDTALCGVPLESVRALADRSPALARRLQVHWLTALDRADAVILDYGRGSARRRVARLLLFLMTAPPDDRCAIFRREDMAAVLDLAPETVSRILNEFQRRGILIKREINHYNADRAALELAGQA